MCLYIGHLSGERERERYEVEQRNDCLRYKAKSKKEGETVGICHRCAAINPKPSVDKKPCGKRTVRKMRNGKADHRGVVRTFFFSESDRLTSQSVPASLADHCNSPLVTVILNLKTFAQSNTHTTAEHSPFSTAWLLEPWGKGLGREERAPRAAVASSRAPVSREHTEVLWTQAR